MATQQNMTRNAKNFIEDKLDSDDVSSALNGLQAVGDSVVRGARYTVDYGRRHPIRMAITVVTLGFLGSLLFRSKIPQTLH
jgi:hypothetical protein